MGRVLNEGQEQRGKKDRAMNESSDLNDTSEQPFGVLSSYGENFDGACDQTAPFGLKVPDPSNLIFGGRKKVRNDDKEGM